MRQLNGQLKDLRASPRRPEAGAVESGPAAEESLRLLLHPSLRHELPQLRGTRERAMRLFLLALAGSAAFLLIEAASLLVFLSRVGGGAS